MIQNILQQMELNLELQDILFDFKGYLLDFIA